MQNQLKKELNKRGVYFLSKLPSYNQVLKAVGEKSSNKELKNQNWAGCSKLLVICDRKLQKKEEVKLWLKDYSVYFVSAGETLKSVEAFSGHIKNILKKTKDKKVFGFISLGGGSVGDWAGFLASVYKRGVPLIHIPTTWLSALDSAHGGKTALNVGLFKNLLGSYHFPSSVFIIKRLFSSLQKKEQESAEGELLKMALIVGGDFYERFKKKKSKGTITAFLPEAILAKLKIVEKDPFGKKGHREHLNLGHTLGHVLESYFNLPHGKAVLFGLFFAIRWSESRVTLSDSFLKNMFFLKKEHNPLSVYLKQIPEKVLKKLLGQDKKRVDKENINFIFLKGPGQVFSEKVSVGDIIKEVKRQAHF